VTALIRYDAARKAIAAAAHRVDEAKKIRDKAEAVRTYAKLAGDVEMQNMACEISVACRAPHPQHSASRAGVNRQVYGIPRGAAVEALCR
jgi:hypothetical protein